MILVTAYIVFLDLKPGILCKERHNVGQILISFISFAEFDGFQKEATVLSLYCYVVLS